MNEKGFGIKEFIIIIAIIFICIIIFMSLTRNVISDNQNESENETTNETLTYQDLEKKLKRGAERYQNNNYSGNIDNKEVWALSYSMLKEEGYLEPIYDINDKDTECTGYVEFIQDGMSISYTPYLKCSSNYVTEGYDEFLQN